ADSVDRRLAPPRIPAQRLVCDMRPGAALGLRNLRHRRLRTDAEADRPVSSSVVVQRHSTGLRHWVVARRARLSSLRRSGGGAARPAVHTEPYPNGNPLAEGGVASAGVPLTTPLVRRMVRRPGRLSPRPPRAAGRGHGAGSRPGAAADSPPLPPATPCA